MSLPTATTPPHEPDDRSTYLHRQTIGYLGLLLPFSLWVIAGQRPTEGIEPRQLLPSVSAYYHTGAVIAFVGVLTALAVFLLTYCGYDNEHGWKDRLAAITAGLAAIFVASFPTAVPAGIQTPGWWSETIGVIHGVAATVLFASFIFFAMFLFTQSGAARLSKGKRARNRVYVLCGVAMSLCMVWAIVAAFRDQSIFWPETLALEFFALSWLVKGRADYTAGAVVSRTIRYGRNPKLLLEEANAAVRSREGNRRRR